MKRNGQLKEVLESDEFQKKGKHVIHLFMERLDAINDELSKAGGRHVICTKCGRLKSYKSTKKKMEKKGLEENFETALEKINDLIGVRAVCSDVESIYKIAEIMKHQKDICMIKQKDYIKKPKKSGYQSLHLIFAVPVDFSDGTRQMKIEVQLRTVEMDCWAALDHQIRYKSGEI